MFGWLKPKKTKVPKQPEPVDEIAIKVKQMIAIFLRVEEIHIAEDRSFFLDLNADTLDMLELCTVILPETFGEEFKVPDEDIESIQEVSDLIRFVKEKKKELDLQANIQKQTEAEKT